MAKDRIQRLEKIQDILIEAEIFDSIYAKDTELKDYAAPVLKSAIACELILQELLIENGISVADGFVKNNDIDMQKGMTVLSYCIREEVPYIPPQTKKLLYVIRTFRNKAAHAESISIGEMQEFRKAFDAFKCWFFNEYDIIRQCGEKTREWFTDYLVHTENNIWIQLEVVDVEKARVAQLKRIRVYADAFGKRFCPAVKAMEKEKPELGAAVSEYQHMMLEIMEQKADMILDAISNSTEALSTKIDNMTETLESLIRQIGSYQALIRNQMDLAVDEGEIERILQGYTNTCVEKIVNDIDSKYSYQVYQTEEEKLQVSLGMAAWNKLSEESRKFLISARITYNYLMNIKAATDYSGVCLLVTKALEIEMKKRFFTNYMTYLKHAYPGSKNYFQFPTAFLNHDKQPIRPREFTLGRVAYILCARFGKNASEEEKRNDREKLVEYCREKLFSGRSGEEILDILENYGKEIAYITEEYRNRAAHTNEVKREDAEMCFHLVLDGDRFLKRMLDSFGY